MAKITNLVTNKGSKTEVSEGYFKREVVEVPLRTTSHFMAQMPPDLGRHLDEANFGISRHAVDAMSDYVMAL